MNHVYRRGNTWWIKFRFQGQVIRESAKTTSKTIAVEAYRVRRRELELAINRISKRERMPLFSIAAKNWFASRTDLAANTSEAYRHFVETLTEEFGSRLVCDIDSDDIAQLQRKRLALKKSARTVNFEINVLRQILKAHRLWGSLADRVKNLKERHDVGRAISTEDERKLLDAAAQSRSPALLPLFVLSLDSGLRASEVRSLHFKHLTLRWENGVIVAGSLIVPQSKTEAATGRVVPLTSRVCAVLTIWLARLSEAKPEDFLFPRHSIGVAGNDRVACVHSIRPDKPMGLWKKAWRLACDRAKAHYRWHDCRHTFVTRLAENPLVSEGTIKALAGHVSRKMLERYSHVRVAAKQAAITALEQASFGAATSSSDAGGAQNVAQQTDDPLPN
jgi:integrase